MIDYQRLDTGTPKDVLVITDDGNAEMAALDEMIKECGFEIELPEDRNADGKFQFTVPGSVVGEFSECLYDIDQGKLEDLLDRWNQETLDVAEE